MNKDLWSKVLNILITVLTAIATTFTTTSCIDLMYGACIQEILSQHVPGEDFFYTHSLNPSSSVEGR